MSSVAAFAFGFILAAIVVTIFAIKIGRCAAQEARRLGYEDGRDAERSIILRQLREKATAPDREVDYPEMWMSDPNDGGSHVPVKFQPAAR